MFSPRYYAVLVIRLLERTEVTLVTKYVYGETVTQDFLLGRFSLGLGYRLYSLCSMKIILCSVCVCQLTFFVFF